MSAFYVNLILLSTLCLTNAKVMRNNALMTKMVSKFQQKDNAVSEEQQSPQSPQSPQSSPDKPARVLSMMQNVLCRNFPSIPCNMIMQDETLQELIKNSIKQIKTKNAPTERINSYLRDRDIQDTNANFMSQPKSHKHHNPVEWHKRKIPRERKNSQNQEAKGVQMVHLSDFRGGGIKKMRKFYPHKIKYKDSNKNRNSEERQSMSAEAPDLINHHRTYEANNPPVWHRDYTKHGEPNVNVVYTDDKDKPLKAKIMKNAAERTDNDRFAKQRKDVLHPDVYIKKRYRKKTVDLHPNSGAE